MTELSFLLDMLLNHRLQKSTRDMIYARVKEVEANLQTTSVTIPRLQMPPSYIGPSAGIPTHLVGQAASTIAAMLKHEEAAPVPVAVIAQTPATQAAMNARQEAIAGAVSGKVEKGRTSPRKF